MKDKKVSIIVPLYNSAEFMIKLVDSILNQTYRNIELILVNDGSPDDSGKIADRYAQKDSRVISLHKSNGGCCDARNYGLARVTGEYLMFADGDDWMEPDCIEYLVTIAEQNNCQMAMSDSIFTTVDRRQNSVDNIRVLTPEEATCSILYVETPVGPWNKLYTTKVIKRNGIDFSVPWFGEGLYFSVTAAQYSNQVVVGHKKVYNYRLNNTQSGTTVRQVKHALNSLWNIKNIKQQLYVKTPATLNAADWHLHRNYFNLLWYIIGANEEEKYKELYQEAKTELRRMLPSVLVKSKVSFTKKTLIILTSLFPKTMSLVATKRRVKKTNTKMKD